jgi:acyl-homoserine-lactone acylase
MFIKRAALLAALACTLSTAAFAQKYDVEIRRTSFGIPHITAKDYGSVAYGIGYSFAQDNVCLMLDELVTINGERSLYYGPDGTYVYGQKNINLDFVMKLVNGDAAQVQAGYNAMSAQTKQAAAGYVAGFNRWLKDNAANIPVPCRGTPIVRNMTELDMYRLFRRYTLESSYVPFLDGLVAAQPPVAPKAAHASKAVRPAGHPAYPTEINPQHAYDMSPSYWREVHADWYEGPASNALAVGQDGVESGRSLLLGTPHFPWFGPLRFYQMHLTIPGELDVMGASLAGAPIVNIGFNQDVAWSHTNDKAWHFNLYQLQLVPGKPTSYIYDGVERQMTPKTVTVKSRGADGVVRDVSTTFWLSHFGPAVVSNQIPIPWTTSFAYVMKDANAKNDRLIDQWLRINRAKSVGDIHTALKEVLGIPWVNTTAVDRYGDAFYSDISATPNISREQFYRCLPPNDFTLAAVFGFGGPAILRGNTSECEWQVTTNDARGELMPGDKLPAIYRRDYAHNANDSFILGNPGAPLNVLNYGPLVGSVEEQGLRTRIGLAQAQARLAGQDGLPGNKFSMQNLQAIALSNRSLGAELFLDDMLKVCTSPDATVQRACNVLKTWDRKFELSSVGSQLFAEIFPRVTRNDATYRVPINWLDMVNTPRGLLTEQPAVANNVITAMKDAVALLDGLSIPIDKPWGQVHLSLKQGVPNVPGGVVPIPISGGPGTALGIYNAINNQRVKDIGYAVVFGTSYIQTVAFDDSGPRAQGFLTYSQSLNPASPHYMDQTMRFSRKQWIDLPFTDAQIRADPALTTTTLRE